MDAKVIWLVQDNSIAEDEGCLFVKSPLWCVTAHHWFFLIKSLEESWWGSYHFLYIEHQIRTDMTRILYLNIAVNPEGNICTIHLKYFRKSMGCKYVWLVPDNSTAEEEVCLFVCKVTNVMCSYNNKFRRGLMRVLPCCILIIRVGWTWPDCCLQQVLPNLDFIYSLSVVVQRRLRCLSMYGG